MKKYEAAQLMPKVGDVLTRTPTIVQVRGCKVFTPAQPCVVVEVNTRALWYRVQFRDGSTECYKVPTISGDAHWKEARR